MCICRTELCSTRVRRNNDAHSHTAGFTKKTIGWRKSANQAKQFGFIVNRKTKNFQVFFLNSYAREPYFTSVIVLLFTAIFFTMLMFTKPKN